MPQQVLDLNACRFLQLCRVGVPSEAATEQRTTFRVRASLSPPRRPLFLASCALLSASALTCLKALSGNTRVATAQVQCRLA